MEELDIEILEVDTPKYQGHRRVKSMGGRPLLQGTLKSDFRIYSTRLSYIYSSFYTQQREISFKKARLAKW